MSDERPGYHTWTAKNGQTFWCKCQIGKNHRKEPEFSDAEPGR
jgi:hypothetical protein